MKVKYTKAFVLSLLVIGLLSGCEEKAKTIRPVSQIELGLTIGELTEVFSSETIAVEGYALVGALRGTGSSQCPVQIRNYLHQYILKQLPGEKNADQFINSPNTAVVYIYGTIPAMATKGDRFDVKVVSLPGTQTTSLEGGVLWGSELKARGRFGISSKILAEAEGPVYIDKLDSSETDKKEGFVLGGGRVLEDYPINMVIREPGYRNSAQIRNRINERFGFGTAEATIPVQIVLRIPEKYKTQKQKFISLVRATYLNESAGLIRQRVERLVQELVNSESKDASELYLEAIGTPAADKLASLLNSPEEQTRMRAGRCLLNIGDDRGLQPLREIALNTHSSNRIEALKAIANGARRNDTSSICQRLLRDDDFEVRIAGYEELLKIDDITVRRENIGRSLYLDKVSSASHQSIFVSRSGVPRIAIFGAPIYCRPETFIRSDDGRITIDAPLDSERVRLIRKVPDVPPITVESSYKLSDIIKTLCEEAIIKDPSRKPGLNVPYCDMIEVIKKMCDKGALLAEFKASHLPKID